MNGAGDQIGGCLRGIVGGGQQNETSLIYDLEQRLNPWVIGGDICIEETAQSRSGVMHNELGDFSGHSGGKGGNFERFVCGHIILGEEMEIRISNARDGEWRVDDASECSRGWGRRQNGTWMRSDERGDAMTTGERRALGGW